MLAWPRVDVPMPLGVVERALAIYQTARRSGATIRSSVECLIAASALEHDLTVVHCDRDYGAIARVTGLRHFDIGHGV